MSADPSQPVQTPISLLDPRAEPLTRTDPAGPAPAKRGPHRFQKGMPSANPKGRPRAGTAFAEAVREKVDPGELIDIALDIARGLPAVQDLEFLRKKAEAVAKGEPLPKLEGVQVKWPTQAERLAALTFLRDAGYTKPAQQLEVGAISPKVPTLEEASHMSDAELAELERLHRKAMGIVDVVPGPEHALPSP